MGTSDVKPRFIPSLKFYFLILFYSIKNSIFHFVNRLFNSQKYKKKQKIVIPPKCISTEDNGIHHYAKLAHTKLHYVEKGNRNNRLLILLHGYPEFWYSWRFQLRHLSMYYWVIAIDLKGFGESDKPRSTNEYDVPILVEELRDFLRAVGKSKCSIVAHGLGGLVGWYFINEYPGIVESFVSVASPHPVSFMQELNSGRAKFKGWFYSCLVPYLPEAEAMKDNLRIFDKLFITLQGSRRGNMTKHDLEAYKYTFARLEDWIGPINYFRSMMIRLKKYKRPLKRTRIPVLFIIGNSDMFCTLEMICKSSEYVENFTIKIVEGGGHFLNQEMPNYINSLILDFLKVPENDCIGDDESDSERSIFRKMFGAGKTVVNYGNQVWNTSKDAMAVTSFHNKLRLNYT